MEQGTYSTEVVRYRTNRFVTNAKNEAEQYAARRGVSFSTFEQTANVRLLHRTELWAWWDDLIMTTAVGLPESFYPQYLTRTAEQLIQKVWISDQRTPTCGWHTLAAVKQIETWEELAAGPTLGNYRPESLVRLRVRYIDGSRGRLYRWFSAEQTDNHRWDYSHELPINVLRRSTITNSSALVFVLISDLISEKVYPDQRLINHQETQKGAATIATVWS